MSIFMLMIQFDKPRIPPKPLTHPQSALQAFQLSLLNHRLVLNAEKTKYTVLSSTRNHSDITAIKTLNGTYILLPSTVDIFIIFSMCVKNMCMFWFLHV